MATHLYGNILLQNLVTLVYYHGWWFRSFFTLKTSAKSSWCMLLGYVYLYNPFIPFLSHSLEKDQFFFKIKASNSTLRMNDILKDPSVFQRCVLGPRNVIQLLWSFLGSLFILWDLVTIPLELYDACRPNHDEIWEVFAPPKKKPFGGVFPWLTCGSPEQKHHTICEA